MVTEDNVVQASLSTKSCLNISAHGTSSSHYYGHLLASHLQEMLSSKAMLGKLTPNCTKQKPLKVMVLGLAGVGKTALTVRFVTKRFIGEYDPTLERIYSHQTTIDNEQVYFDILDTAGQSHETECSQLETNMRWADAFILMYSVTDKCSFDECNRLKFLINYNKRRRRLVHPFMASDSPLVVLVGNKTDQLGDRMVSKGDGKRRSSDIGCVSFHEVSVRESVDEVREVFEDIFHKWRSHCKTPRLKRSTSDLHHGQISIDTINVICGGAGSSKPTPTTTTPTNLWTERLLEGRAASADLGRFRERASTDGQLTTKKLSYQKVKLTLYNSPRLTRRMSISMRGSNSNC